MKERVVVYLVILVVVAAPGPVRLWLLHRREAARRRIAARPRALSIG